MIEKLPRGNGDQLAFRAWGKLTDQDYQTVFLPEMDKALRDSGAVRVMLVLEDGFAGWDLGAAWDDLKFGMAHRNQFEKVAVVGGKKWVEWGVKLDSHFMKGQAKTFAPGEMESAWAWLTA